MPTLIKMSVEMPTNSSPFKEYFHQSAFMGSPFLRTPCCYIQVLCLVYFHSQEKVGQKRPIVTGACSQVQEQV